MELAGRNFFGLIILGFVLSSCQPAERQDNGPVLLDVMAIANKKPAQVEAIIGEPDSVYTLHVLGRPIFCQLYKAHNIEIQYPESVATDIVVKDARGLPFDQTALSAFNLDYRRQHPSDYKKGNFIRWSDFEAFSAISFYNPTRDSANAISGFDIFFKVKDIQQAGGNSNSPE